MQKIRVLVVDDEIPFLNRLLQYDWEKVGCLCVGSAANGKEALEACRRLLPHLVITDINMPLMDGIQLMSSLRNEFPDIQIILLTVLESFEFARQAVEYGAVGYVVKGVDFTGKLEESLAKVREMRAADGSQYVFSEDGVLLSKSGKIIQLPPYIDITAYARELDRFIHNFQGTLITAKTRIPCRKLPHAGEPEEMQTGLPGNQRQMGIIIHSQNLMEIIIKMTVTEAGEWFGHLLQTGHNLLGLRAEDCRYACSGDVVSLNDYYSHHRQNIAAINQGFYAAEPTCLTAFSKLPAALISEWIRKLEFVSSRYDKIEQYIRAEIVPEIIRRNFEPADVAGAFIQMIRQLDFLYAAKEEDDQLQCLSGAWTLQELVELFLAKIKALLGNGSNYCYEVKSAISFIRANLSNPDLSLADVANSVNISVGYLSKLIKEATGESYKDMLIRLRMEYAANLLRTTNAKVYELAEKTGYQNYRSFAKTFFDFYGINPKQYSRQ